MQSNLALANQHFDRGNELFGQGHVIQAMDEWKIAVRLNPNHPDAHLNLGMAFLERDEFDDAIKELDAAYRLDPNNKTAVEQLATALNERGSHASDAGDTTRAEADWDAVLDIDPDNSDAHYNLGLTLAEQDNLVDAEEHFRSAIKSDPEDLEIRSELASVLVRLERPIDAIHVLEEALETGTKLNQTLGRVSSSMLPIDSEQDAGALERNVELLERASASYDSIALALAKLWLQQGDVNQAQKVLEQAQFDKESAPVWADIGRTLVDQGQTEDAVIALRRAYLSDPNLTEPRELLDRLGKPYEEPPEPFEDESVEANEDKEDEQ